MGALHTVARLLAHRKASCVHAFLNKRIVKAEVSAQFEGPRQSQNLARTRAPGHTALLLDWTSLTPFAHMHIHMHHTPCCALSHSYTVSVREHAALGPGALAAFLQTYGQARVPATMAQVRWRVSALSTILRSLQTPLGVTASASQWSPRSTSTEPENCVSLAPQVIYSLTPLWSALIAWAFLGNDDGLGPLGWAGGAVILMASILATTGAKQEDLRDKELNKS